MNWLRILFTPDEVLVRGFRLMSGLAEITQEDYNKAKVKKFKEHFGVSPTLVGIIWSDIITMDIDLGLHAKDKSEQGFKRLLTAIHFLWAYPKNAALLASAVGTCKRNVEGGNLWKWVKALAALKSIKIVWPEDEYNNPERQIFIISVDGVDFKVWEKKHPRYNIDKGQYSHKLKHGALKYEIAIDAYSSKVVWINGPHRGAEHDKSIYNILQDGYQSLLAPNHCVQFLEHNECRKGRLLLGIGGQPEFEWDFP